MFACCNSGKTSTHNTVKLLLENGADVNAKDCDGYTAYDLAKKFQHNTSSKETVQLLRSYI